MQLHAWQRCAYGAWEMSHWPLRWMYFHSNRCRGLYIRCSTTTRPRMAGIHRKRLLNIRAVCKVRYKIQCTCVCMVVRLGRDDIGTPAFLIKSPEKVRHPWPHNRRPCTSTTNRVLPRVVFTTSVSTQQAPLHAAAPTATPAAAPPSHRPAAGGRVTLRALTWTHWPCYPASSASAPSTRASH